ncbi:MAG: CocE/NonD family hydrolase [Ornithinimicrobium sp.]
MPSLAARFLGAATLGVLLGAAPVVGPSVALPAAHAQSAAETVTVPVGPEPDGTEVALDADIYRPTGGGPAPAVILGHGFGGSKDDLVDQAQTLADNGYVALAYSARGFGDSEGRVHLNDPDFEIADAQALIDLLAQDSGVQRDADNDPRVGLVGGSYGGAMALMTAGADDRVDSVIAQITWNDLADAFYPQAASDVDAPGPFKKLWASAFFTAILGADLQQGTGEADRASEVAETGGVAGGAALCGRFDPELCQDFVAAMESQDNNEDLIDQLRDHSPAPTLDQISAPTYLVQGMSDSLFGLDQADANATALRQAGVPVAVNWFNGGHDGQSAVPEAAQPEGGPPGNDGTTPGGEPADLEQTQTQDALTWLDGTLRSPDEVTQDSLPLPAFSYAAPPPTGGQAAQQYTGDVYPGLDGAAGNAQTTQVPLSATGPPVLISPPGGVPESLTTVPGLGGVLGALPTYSLAALPGQSVAFDTEALSTSMLVAGAPRVSLDVTSSGATSTLFVSLWEVQPGGPVLPRRLVAPVKVEVTPGSSERVDVALPGGTWQMPAGSTWRVLVSATDGSYRVDPTTRIDQVALAQPSVTLPVVEGTAVSPSSRWDSESIGVAVALTVLLVLIGLAALRARTRPHPQREDYLDVPLVVSGLTKAYPDGHKAVDDVSWRAERGQVVGLLGPNGAGKTTTLRMVMGLIGRDSGTVHVLGQPVYAGAPVLQRVGALVEGPGFLPHLSGLENLKAYWAATGRPTDEALFEDALEIAALGDAVHRPVKSYSQGMRQRLGIAQAMLGMPEVLILDEPTNGLDPPQIAAMRPMLQRYAEAGRTVVVSSHLLAEVEMTCSHVVVMHAGRVLAAGSVQEVGVAEGRNLESVFLSTIAGANDGAALNAVRPR